MGELSDQPDEVDLKAADIRAEMLQRSRGMTMGLREELFVQRRLVRDSNEEVSPTLIVGSAEGTSIFRGLNHSRNLMEPIRRALKRIAEDPDRARKDYEQKVQEARAGNARTDSSTDQG